MNKAVIIAGGKGTRLGFSSIPKPMVQIGNTPLLLHQIKFLKKFGIDNVFILSGYKAEIIADYFKDGSDYGIKITHIREDSPLGTAGSVKQLGGIINERFLVLYGDVFPNFDLDAFINFDSQAPSVASIIVHPNDHPYDSDLVNIDEYSNVTEFYSKPHDKDRYYRNLVNAAVYILDPVVFKYIPEQTECDFGRNVFPELLALGKRIRAYKTAEYIKDMGTPERLQRVIDDYSSGKIERLCKKNKRSAIFLDRDGTIVEYVDLLYKPVSLELYPFTAAAIKKINKSDYLSILVTNQPVIARNLCNTIGLRAIHNKLETLLGMEGAYLDDIYYCPHHPDSGYPEENKTYKINCSCRKPAIGMIENAISDFNIDISTSWIIGDTTTDIKAGKNAGLNTIVVKTGKSGLDGKYEVSPDYEFDSLYSAVDFILLGNKNIINKAIY